jgi:hypothetical protein
VGAAVKGRITVGVAAILLALTSSAKAHPSGNDVLPFCEMKRASSSDKEAWKEQWLNGNCWGAVSSLIAISSALHPTAKFCPPNESTVQQGMSIVVKALKNTPKTSILISLFSRTSH